MMIRFQQGGGLPPLVSYTPVNQAKEAPPQQMASEDAESKKAKKSSDDEKGDLTKKDFYNMLKEVDGLPNDTTRIFHNITQMLEWQELYEGTPLSNNNLASMYLRILQQIKNAKFNKVEYDHSYEISKSKDALPEIAITPFGKLVVQDAKGQLKEVSVEEFHKNRDSFVPITNSQLLTMRSQDPRMVFNNKILQTVENGIGMSAVQELIKKASVQLGTSKEGQEGYVNTNPQVSQGLEFLKDAAAKGANPNGMSIADLYKASYLTSQQAQQAQLAIQYILNMLPVNARTLLEFKTGSAKGVEALIVSNIMSQVNTDFQFKLDSESSKSKSSKGSGSDDTNDDAGKLSPVARAVLGDGEQSTLLFSPEMGNLGLRVNVTTNPIVDPEGNPMGQITMDKLLKSGYDGALDSRNATMGGQVINTIQFSKVFIEDGKINMAEWIIDPVQAKSGIIAPDLNLLEKQKVIQQKIKDQRLDPSKPQDIEKINKLYTSANLPIKYNKDGSVNYSNYRRFAMFQTVTSSLAFKHPDQLIRNKWATELDEDETDTALESFATATGKKVDDIEFDKNNWYDFNGHDSMYRGIVFMPVTSNMLAAMGGDKSKITQEQRENIRANQHRSDNMQKFQPQGGLDD